MAGLPPPYGAPPPLAPGAGYELPVVSERLHPVSILVRIGRAALALVWVVLIASANRSQGGGHNYYIDVAITGFVVITGVIAWIVTTWRVDNDVLEVCSGLIRRRTVRLPLSRLQAVDLVEPWIARVFGMAEVRVRSGGGGQGDARLQYLPVNQAQAVRSALIALAHGLPGSTPEAPERPLVRQENGVLVRGLLVTQAALLPICSLGATAVLAAFRYGPAASAVGIYAVLFGIRFGRRIANLWGFTASESPDGLRLRTGLGSRVRETVPLRRVQAVVRYQPFFWQWAKWWSLSMHLAGGVAHRRNQPRGPVRRALFPVGREAEVDRLVGHILGRSAVSMSRPPRRAMLRAPFSYHFLAAGHDGMVASSSTGRVRRREILMPLAKVQSVRFVQGPVSRKLGLASVRLDAAGRGAVLSWRFFEAEAMWRIVYELVDACAVARSEASEQLTASPLLPPPPPPPPPPPVHADPGGG